MNDVSLYLLYAFAILTHFGHWVDISSEYGRRRLPRWMPLPGLAYAQVVKRRIKRRLVHVSHKVVYGSKERLQSLLKQSIGNVINTSFVERVNLTLRHHDYIMLQRNLLYTAITRAKKLVLLVSTKKAISMAMR